MTQVSGQTHGMTRLCYTLRALPSYVWPLAHLPGRTPPSPTPTMHAVLPLDIKKHDGLLAWEDRTASASLAGHERLSLPLKHTITRQQKETVAHLRRVLGDLLSKLCLGLILSSASPFGPSLPQDGGCLRTKTNTSGVPCGIICHAHGTARL